ncbi:MAG: hypothetical protein KGJ43_01585, partial [Acidobacteriota bacterium]|nr:hypothetical protein [Acidobacteriota bacterium]
MWTSALLAGPARAGEAAGGEEPSATVAGLYGYQPYTPWRKPPVRVPNVGVVDYQALTEAGLRQAERWHRGGWYCEYLGCSNGPYPLATIWATVPVFESAAALQIAQPSGAHRALVEHLGHESERFWDNAAGGYAPYPGDREANVEIWFDDNGWLGLAFLNAYRATHNGRWFSDARRAFGFITAHGWDASGGGGMWWNTQHP